MQLPSVEFVFPGTAPHESWRRNRAGCQKDTRQQSRSENAMNGVLNENLRRSLLLRRDRVKLTLRNLELQKLNLHRRTLGHDETIEPSRSGILEALDDWYHKELNEINDALIRAENRSLGICLGCNSEIDPGWLEIFSEAEFCHTCENLKKWMELG
jgi:RNA polymerase-binding transcription factor DksA